VTAYNGVCKCLHISKDAFEEVLGPLQAIIDDDRQQREKAAREKQILMEQEGLSGVKIGDFTLEGICVSADPVQYVLAKHKGKEYTLKAISKAKTVQMGLQTRIMHEKELTSALYQQHKLLPLALKNLEDEGYLYSVYKTRVCVDLASLIGETPFDEKTTMFYTASVALALMHLQRDAASPACFLYRNLTTDAIVLDANGYVQLLDMRNAVKADPAPTDFCGYAHYLSPEQVSGQGHGFAVDWWALGTLTYEMISGGANPWLTGDPAKDSEVGIYQRISMHQPGALKFPDGVEPSADLKELLNDLMHPSAPRRLGSRGVGPSEIKDCKWFASFDWGKLGNGNLDAPHKKQAAESAKKAMSTGGSKSTMLPDGFNGDKAWYSGWSQS